MYFSLGFEHHLKIFKDFYVYCTLLWYIVNSLVTFVILYIAFSILIKSL